MRHTTAKRYAMIRQAAGELYGTMPVMKIYVELGERFNLSDEHIRRILRKKRPP
jgi:Mor family transcriptional regulator